MLTLIQKFVGRSLFCDLGRSGQEYFLMAQVFETIFYNTQNFFTQMMPVTQTLHLEQVMHLNQSCHIKVWNMNIKIFIQHSPCKLSGRDLVIDCYPPYGFVTTPGTTIISPNYPNYYPSNDISYCQVTLIFEDRISIEFESFDVGSDGSCSLDWFRVFG